MSLELANREKALVVPAAAVTMHEDRPCVLVAQDGKVVRKPVVPGIRSGDELEIVSGLGGDEAIIVAKGASITEGQAVEPVKAASAK